MIIFKLGSLNRNFIVCPGYIKLNIDFLKIFYQNIYWLCSRPKSNCNAEVTRFYKVFKMRRVSFNIRLCRHLKCRNSCLRWNIKIQTLFMTSRWSVGYNFDICSYVVVFCRRVLFHGMSLLEVFVFRHSLTMFCSVLFSKVLHYVDHMSGEALQLCLCT